MCDAAGRVTLRMTDYVLYEDKFFILDKMIVFRRSRGIELKIWEFEVKILVDEPTETCFFNVLVLGCRSGLNKSNGSNLRA